MKGKNKQIIIIIAYKRKKVLFDEKTLKMIEMMIPTYKDEISNTNKENEKINQMIKLAIEKMFKNDFLNKINNF
ncbi:mobilization protein [Campylobacter jejuni]|nr:mobilization protein [Campylobacter jejuni]RTI69207.1 mobilization protein [Campylobacter jejuni]RTI78645.1 mobilization protein [Campylobacter jejuni]